MWNWTKTEFKFQIKLSFEKKIKKMQRNCRKFCSLNYFFNLNQNVLMKCSLAFLIQSCSYRNCFHKSQTYFLEKSISVLNFPLVCFVTFFVKRTNSHCNINLEPSEYKAFQAKKSSTQIWIRTLFSWMKRIKKYSWYCIS